jgi:hypothetical protein
MEKLSKMMKIIREEEAFQTGLEDSNAVPSEYDA